MDERNEGLAIHCHHNILMEYCYNYKGRVAVINSKPQYEIETRLRLFRLLSDEAIADLPKAWVEADKARDKADKAWFEADKAWVEADKARVEAYKSRDKADKAWVEADKARWHQKWCGCTEWDGEQIVFPAKALTMPREV